MSDVEMPQILPSSQRSLDEVEHSTLISSTHGRATRQFILDDLRRGDSFQRSDMAFQIGNWVIVYEHDPVYWHPEERDDCSKTQKLLAIPNTLVVRARIGAHKLPIEHSRLVQLILPKNAKHEDVMNAYIQGVSAHIPDHCFHIPDTQERKALLSLAKSVFEEIHPNYATKVSERAHLLQQHNLEIDPAILVGIPLVTLSNNIGILKKMDFNPAQIAKQPSLLGRDPKSLQRNAEILQNTLGLTKEKIAQQPSLLGRDPKSLQKNAKILQNTLGLTKEKIATCAFLLGCDPASLQKNAEILQDTHGLTKEQIATCACLLTRDPKSLQNNAEILQDKLRLTKDEIAKQPSLLGRDPKSLQKNAMWYDSNGFKWRNDLAMLSLSLDRVKDALDFLVNKCNIDRNAIKKQHVTRFKAAQKQILHDNVFMSKTPREKLSILQKTRSET